MVNPSLLFPSPSASPFCAYFSKPPLTSAFIPPSHPQPFKKHLNLNMFRICTFIDLNHDCIILWRCWNPDSSLPAWCRANQNSRIPISSRPPRLQTCRLCPCLLVCMHSAISVKKLCQSQVRQSAQRSATHSPSQLFACQPFGFRGTKNGAGNDHLHLCQPVKPNPRRQNEHCQDLTCQSVSGTHLLTCPSTAPQGAILLLLALIDERGRGVAPFPFPEYLKIDRVSLMSFLAAASLSLSWHIVGELQKAAICPGSCNPNLKYKRDMIPLNLEQIPLSLQISVTRRWKVWTRVSNAKFCALPCLGGTLYFVHLTSTAVASCTTLWMFQGA